MNARASLVDEWRNIEFVADQLEAGLDVVFEGDVGNTGDNPFRIRFETGELRAGLQFDSPLVRLSERNNYRNALISYQQSKRSLYQFEDSVKANIRNIIRSVDRLKILFELDRLTVQTEIDNVEINRYEIDRPVAPGSANSRVGTQTAQNLANAINGLNNAQNSFLGSWVQFEILRRSLDFDMGTMQVDQTGAWLDPGEMDSSIATRAASMMGIQLDCQFCKDVEFSFDNQTTEFDYSDSQAEDANSLEFESDEPTEPIGTTENDPNVLETDSRSIDREPPSTIDDKIDGLIDRVPTEDTDTSSLQRSNLTPRKLFRPIRSTSKTSPKKRSQASKSAAVKNVKPTLASKASKLDPATNVAQHKPVTDKISIAEEFTFAEPIAFDEEASNIPSALTEPVSDNSNFSGEGRITTASFETDGLDNSMHDRALERASFWAFLEQNESDPTFFNEAIQATYTGPEPSLPFYSESEVAQKHASESEPVSKPVPKPVSKPVSIRQSQASQDKPKPQPQINPQPEMPRLKTPSFSGIAAQSKLKSKLKSRPETAQSLNRTAKTKKASTTAQQPRDREKQNWEKQDTSLGGVLNRFRSR